MYTDNIRRVEYDAASLLCLAYAFSKEIAVAVARKNNPIRKVRSPFGTRVARKITCSSCGAQDTIHFSPKPGQKPLCRQCAAQQFGVVDHSSSIGPQEQTKCERCGLYLPKICTFEDPLDCPEHARALALRQSHRASSGTRSSKNVVRIRRNPKE